MRFLTADIVRIEKTNNELSKGLYEITGSLGNGVYTVTNNECDWENEAHEKYLIFVCSRKDRHDIGEGF